MASAAPLRDHVDPLHYHGDITDTLGRADFDRIATIVNEVSGIKMPRNKVTMLEGRLRRRVRATGQASIAAYCDWLFAGDNLAREGDHLINAVTTNKTDFFREPRHFDYLQQSLLPAMARGGQRRLRVWSAGCSTGAEPYTIAMLLDAFARDQGGPGFEIVATDLDTEVLEAARRGIYPVEMVAPVPPTLRNRYVLAANAKERREVRIVPHLRASILFGRLNLMDAQYPVGDPMDLIFCRNVLIYFEKAVQEQVVRRLLDRLRPGGLLFLGHSESIAGIDLPVVQVAGTIFRRS